MLATLGALPEQQDGWAFEMKWDGVRGIVYTDGASVRVMSRNDRDVSVTYPELAGLGAALGGRQVVLDGEVVAFDAEARPSFRLLQQRIHVADPAAARRLAERVPAVYLVFDLVQQDGAWLLDRPYAERRAALDALALDGQHWHTPPAFDGDGPAAVAASQGAGLEGVVAKRLSSRYQPGRRSPDWVKVKNVRTQEVVVVGWKPGAGRREGTIGSLLLGVHGPAGWEYVGGVGTGFTAAMLDDMLAQLRPLARPTPVLDVPRADARDARWVAPEVVGEVAFGEWTGDGRLRHPAWRGLRTDKSPDDVVRES